MFKPFKKEDAQARRVSLFDMELGEVMVMQDCKELLSAKLEHIFVPFELKHVVPQGLGVCPVKNDPINKTRILTFDSEEA